MADQLHTVSSSASEPDALDFRPGYECYVDCDTSSDVALCSKPAH